MNIFEIYKKVLLSTIVTVCITASAFCILKLFSDYRKIVGSVGHAVKHAAQAKVLKTCFFFLPF